jgi:CRISPR-associated protein Csm5
MSEHLRCSIKTVAPVHLGCDDVYEPTGFIVDEQRNKLVVFDTNSFLAQLESKKLQDFSDICRKGTVSSILEIYKFLRKEKPVGRDVDVSEGFVKHYNRTLGISQNDERKIQQELNRFTIARTAYLPNTDRPYIPGSAIKGAIRTAYLNHVTGSTRLSGFDKGKPLEKKLLDTESFDTDPFRMLKVSDFMPIGSIETKILYAVNEKKKISRFVARGPYQILEVIQPGAEFEGWITVDVPLIKGGIKNPLTLEGILQSLNKFYLETERKREQAELASIGVQDALPVLNGAALLRIGRHSGAESVTIEGHRNIRIMGSRDKPTTFQKNATTLWLASDTDKSPVNKSSLKPFGWASLAEIGHDQEREFAQREADWRAENESERSRFFAQVQTELSSRAEQIRIAEELARNRQLETERLAAEEAARQEAIARMSPEEKIAEELRNPRVAENRVYDIFNQLETFDQKALVAQALKEVWIRSGKWTKKECTAKQWKKVQQIKAILGEE